jgi:RNA polymerase sigma-70 factor (ECF subfamily)
MIVDFCSLYERYAQDIYRFALYLCSDPSLAEEMTSETFVRAWTTPGEIRLPTAKAYLFTIARNLYRSSLKQQANKAELDESLPDWRPGPDVLAGTRSELEAVLEGLKMLPEMDRAALLMHAQDGMQYAEIAAALGISLAAVKVKIHRSRLKLNQLFNRERV